MTFLLDSYAKLPKIEAFPKGPNFWRVDWFGDIAFPDRTVRRKQPSVFVHLSKVTDPTFLDDPAALMRPDAMAPARFQRKVWVSVGTLVLLRIGDIWQDGGLHSRPDYELEQFNGIKIDRNTTMRISAIVDACFKLIVDGVSAPPWTCRGCAQARS